MGKVKHIKASKRTELQKKLRDIPYDIDLFSIASALIDGKTTKSRLLDGNYEKLSSSFSY
jgi:hypothetical protein